MSRFARGAALGLALSLLAAAPAAAQSAYWGATGGVSIATIDFDEDLANEDALESRTGMHVGLFVDFPLTSGIGLRPGVYYTSGGAKLTDGNDEYDLTLDYIQIPVLLRLGVPLDLPVSIHALAGLYAGFEVACEFEVEGLGDAVECDGDEVAGDGFATKGTEFGAQLGAGLAFGLAEGINLLAEGGYQFGLTNVSDSEVDSDAFKNRRWLVDLGLTVDLGG